jgi:hypothetical protein
MHSTCGKTYRGTHFGISCNGADTGTDHCPAGSAANRNEKHHSGYQYGLTSFHRIISMLIKLTVAYLPVIFRQFHAS